MTLILFMAGCASIGPGRIRGDRQNYNGAMRETQLQEILRNIVRIRYGDSTYFLTVSSITSSYTLSPSINGSYSQTMAPGAYPSMTASLSPTLSYSDSPTIQYMPVSSSDFVNELLTPVPLTNLFFLMYGGVKDPDPLFRLVISNLSGMPNAEVLSAPQASTQPIYKQYYHMLEILRQCIDLEIAKIRPVTEDNIKYIGIIFEKGKERTRPAMALKKMLKVSPDAKDIISIDRAMYDAQQAKAKLDTPIDKPVEKQVEKPAEKGAQPAQNNAPTPNVAEVKKPIVVVNNKAFVMTRSLLGVLNYIAHNVQVPPMDTIYGFAPHYQDDEGRPYEMGPLFNHLCKIYYSEKEPKFAYLKVFEHDHWFYIKDNDTDSKLTFNFVNLLVTLQAGNTLNTTGPGPILTIPTR